MLKNLQNLTGDNRYVFPGDSIDGVMNLPRKPIAQICAKTGIDFSNHDLKRTFWTIGEATMIPFSLLKTLANHKSDGDVTAGYINTETHTMRQAIYKIGEYIELRSTYQKSS